MRLRRLPIGRRLPACTTRSSYSRLWFGTYAEVAEFYSGVVGEESDVAGGAAEAGMLLQDFGIGDGGEVGVDDDGAVEGHDDVRADGGDLLLVPLADGFQESGFGGEDVVNGAVILGRAELAFIDRGVMIEDLNFHAEVGGVAFEGGADADAVVGAFGELEVETENEVGVLGFGEEVAVGVRGGDEESVFDEVAGAAADVAPAVEGVSVK